MKNNNHQLKFLFLYVAQYKILFGIIFVE